MESRMCSDRDNKGRRYWMVWTREGWRTVSKASICNGRVTGWVSINAVRKKVVFTTDERIVGCRTIRGTLEGT